MDMKKGLRYNTTGMKDADFEPGTRQRVIKNSLGIKSKREIDKLEAKKLQESLEKIINMYDKDHRFTINDICKMHKIWLGDIYPWAGKFRQVNMAKGGFEFAAASRIPHLMKEFGREQLEKFTPCCFNSLEEIITAIAITHTEFILIHPFREGNGRLGRLLAWVMGFQAGLPLLDFSNVKGKKKKEYFSAVRAGIDQNYEPMKKIFSAVIRRTLKVYAE
jgi:cell filamentation protein